jgi:DNA-binding MarR family transcriptional regulator
MSPVEELRYLILGAQREGNRIFADALRLHGLTPSQAEALRVIGERGPLALLELGRLLVCESGSPSRLVDGLVRAGLVERVDDPSDRRRVTLSLTPAGREAVSHVAEAEAELYDLLDAVIPPHKLAATIDVLRTLVAGRPAGNALELRRTTA